MIPVLKPNRDNLRKRVGNFSLDYKKAGKLHDQQLYKYGGEPLAVVLLLCYSLNSSVAGRTDKLTAELRRVEVVLRKLEHENRCVTWSPRQFRGV